jgi:sporulation protein YlmC with PRC-barrel domain
MMKRVLTATALAVVLAVPAFAQQPMSKSDTVNQNSATISASAGFVQQQTPTEWRGSKLIGANVYGPDNNSIGEINDVIVASDGQVKAAVIGVGGFLGVGEKNVAVPFNSLHVQPKADSSTIEKITVSYTKDELKNAPKFAYFEASGAQTTGSGNVPRMDTAPRTTPMSNGTSK